ncbi:major surface protease gp63 [Novymonas esmeraldas]|uniref:Leishmanolysin-like peptidase n=1 Tax=Novymonas esmeraldas TaxID=1808958 RepID=A0AAW0F3L0_9TRYP
MRRSLLQAAVVIVLLCVAARGWPESVGEHRLGFHGRQEPTSDTHVGRVAETAGKPTMVKSPAERRPLRIAVFTGDIADSSRYCTAAGQIRPNFQGKTTTCGPDDVLTDSKKQTLLEFMIPSAVRLHQERLSVQRERGNIVVNSSIKQDPICGQFSIPASHMTTGVANADFVLYVAAGPIANDTIAWALTCQYFANGRPSVGVVDVSPDLIAASPQTVRFVAHEILHALGFNFHTFHARRMVGTVRMLRGKTNVTVIKSPMVVAQARAHFGCKEQNFLELEDMGGEGTEHSHWKRRSMKDDLMAGSQSAGIYSAITIAAMEDTGFYKGNYSMAEPMMYGRNAGCRLLKDKCVVKGVSQFPEMFCGSANRTDLVCASDRLGVGSCHLTQFSSPLPATFQYFSDPKLGGSHDLMDHCPVVHASRTASCAFDGMYLKGSVYGARSRCFDAPAGIAESGRSSAQYGICAEVQCADSAYAIKVSGAKMFTRCKPGTTLPLSLLSSTFSSGHITCPPVDSVCGIRVSTTQAR